MQDSCLLKMNMAIIPCIINSIQNSITSSALSKLTKDWQSLPFICMIFCSYRRVHTLSSIRSLPWQKQLHLRHNSVCCACHLLDAATNLCFISKVANISQPPDGSEDPYLWQNSCRNAVQTWPSGRQLTSLTGAKQAFPHHLLITLVTEIQCPQQPQ